MAFLGRASIIHISPFILIIYLARYLFFYDNIYMAISNQGVIDMNLMIQITLLPLICHFQNLCR